MMNLQQLLFLLFLLCAKSKLILTFMMKCPAYKLHLQKVLGFRPPADVSTARSLLQDSAMHRSGPINLDCLRACQFDENCIGYVLLLEANDCFGYTLLQQSSYYTSISTDEELVLDPNAIYFQKVCLNVPENCKTKLWAIAKIPGSSLVFQGKKTLSTLVTRRECAEKCIFESEFQCLSASFRPSHKNNYARLTDLIYGCVVLGSSPAASSGTTSPLKLHRNVPNQGEVLGQCVLSDRDKNMQPDAFRVGSMDEEYIENQCASRPVENENCSYELYSNSSFTYSEIKYDGISQRECKYNCTHETRFFCQGVTHITETDGAIKCFLHSEDIISMGPRSLVLSANSVYMRRVKCLNVSVACDEHEMVITYTPSNWFGGKLYVSSHSKDCVAEGNETKPTVLHLPIGNEIKENKCGILRAYEPKGKNQRTLISTLIVVQNNINVQTQGDRMIKVGCILYDTNASLSTIFPDDVALESSLAFTQMELPNEGSWLISDSPKLPKIHMQILEVGKRYETNDVQIGQNLELQIVSEPANAEYDFRATSLEAKGYKQNSVTLLDGRGCPTDVMIFPGLEKAIEGNKKILRAKFHAFKFAGTSLVSFDVKIHFCLSICPPVNCENGVVSHGKRKKRNTDLLYGNVTNEVNSGVEIKYPSAFTSITELPNLTNYVKPPTEGQFVHSFTQDDAVESLEVSLNYKLNVHSSQLGEPSSLIYGENGQVLLSDVGIVKSSLVCIDQNLLIAIFVFWAIIQIILMIGCYYLVRRYKRWVKFEDDRHSLQRASEGFDYEESIRRVHWADQGSNLTFTP